MLDQVSRHVEQCFAQLNAQNGKAGQSLTDNEWLMAVRSRIGIPGGTCGFDLPAYHAWQFHDPQVRLRDLEDWASTLTPLGQSRSEEHTSELQSPCNIVCRLLLEKKKQFPESTRAQVCPGFAGPHARWLARKARAIHRHDVSSIGCGHHTAGSIARPDLSLPMPRR